MVLKNKHHMASIGGICWCCWVFLGPVGPGTHLPSQNSTWNEWRKITLFMYFWSWSQGGNMSNQPLDWSLGLQHKWLTPCWWNQLNLLKVSEGQLLFLTSKCFLLKYPFLVSRVIGHWRDWGQYLWGKALCQDLSDSGTRQFCSKNCDHKTQCFWKNLWEAGGSFSVEKSVPCRSNHTDRLAFFSQAPFLSIRLGEFANEMQISSTMTCPWFLSWEKYYQGNPGPSHIFSSHISKCFPIPRESVGYVAGSAVWRRERLRKHSVVLWEDGGKMFSVGGSHSLCKWMLPRMKPQSWTRFCAGVVGGVKGWKAELLKPFFCRSTQAFLSSPAIQSLLQQIN